MGFFDLFPAIAGLLCLEVAVAFGGLYLKVSRRRADLLFSLVALCLAATRACCFLRHHAPSVPLALHWLRLEWGFAFLAMGVFLHFASVAADRPLRAWGLGAVYGLAGTLMALTGSELFIRRPNETVSVALLERAARGPLFLAVAPIPVILAFGALMQMGWSGKSAGDGASLSPLLRERRSIIAGALVLVATPVVAFLAGLAWPEVGYVNIQSLGAMVFCLLVARALGREILRSEQERQRLAQLAQFRAQAIRDVAHELKNPLAAIQMATVSALVEMERGTDPSAPHSLLEMSLGACKHLIRLVNNMLDTARLEAGRKVDLRVEETNLPELLDTVVSLQRSYTVSHDIRCECQLPSPRVPVDPDKLHQILTNLLSNAIKYSPDGGEVTVRVRRQNGELAFDVQDQGIGMTPDQQARLFQPFERVVDPSRKITGTGIGLHLVKRLVEAQGGRIWVESTYGKGSAFHFTVAVGGS